MSHPVLTERDLEFIFSETKKKKNRNANFLRVLLFGGCFISITALVFIVLNFSTLKQNFSFWYETEYKTSALNADAVKLGNINETSKEASFPKIDDSSLFIPAINVTAPISWNVPNAPEKVAEGLNQGLIHIKGTSLPGQIGNVFVTGHSSNYPWARGSYNSVFALLNKLVVGDPVQIKYNNIDYLYKVSEIKVVEPTDVSVLKSKNESTLTLMTCTPVGTTLRRLIVTAKQVYPGPSANVPNVEINTDSNLPAIR